MLSDVHEVMKFEAYIFQQDEHKYRAVDDQEITLPKQNKFAPGYRKSSTGTMFKATPFTKIPSIQKM